MKWVNGRSNYEHHMSKEAAYFLRIMQYLPLLVGLLKSYFDGGPKGYQMLLVQHCLIIPRIFVQLWTTSTGH